MRTVIRNVRIPAAFGFGVDPVDVAVEGAHITAVGADLPAVPGDKTVDGRGDLLLPGFVNTHCHAAMTLFRGYGEDLPLSRWLNERIFPAEDRLTSESVYWGSMLAIAEMLRNGITSFSDMYLYCSILCFLLFISYLTFFPHIAQKTLFSFITSPQEAHLQCPSANTNVSSFFGFGSFFT